MRALLLAAMALGAFAQNTPLPETPPRDGVIRVSAVNTRGEPLAGVWIVLSGNAQGPRPEPLNRHAATDAGGRARFDRLPNGYYNFSARMAGRRRDSGSDHVQLDGHAAAADFRLVLPRKPVVTGRIVDAAGVPLHNAQVKLLQRTTERGEARVAGSRTAMTDDRGVYRIAVDRPGRYWVMASHTERSFPRGEAPRTTGIAFFPNAPDLLSAAPLDLDYDQPELEADITLPLAPPTMLVAAIVSGASGAPCERCGFTLRKVEGSYEYDIVGGAAGPRGVLSYQGIPAGLYRVYAQDSGLNEGWWAIGETIVVEGRPAEAVIATQPPILVSGRLTLEGAPAAVPASDQEAPKPIQLHLQQQGSHRFFGSTGQNRDRVELTLDEREFAFAPLPPGRYEPNAWVRGANSYIAEIKRQGRPLRQGLLDLTQPGPWTDIEITVRFDPAQPQFQIEGGPPAPGALEDSRYRLLLEPDPETNPFGRRHEAGCTPTGPCALPKAAPGRYTAVAVPWEDDSGGVDLLDREVRQALGPWLRTVTLTPGRNPVVKVTPAPERLRRAH